MKLIVVLTIPIFAFSSNVHAQSDNKVVVFHPDTVYRFQGIVPPVEFQYDLNQLIRVNLNEQIPTAVLFSEESSNIWLRTEMMISNRYFFLPDNEINTHFTSSLHKRFLEESEFDMVRYVLGMAQLSAVAYLAYRHIKKYGFLK